MVNGKASGSNSMPLTMPLTLKVIADSGLHDDDDDDDDDDDVDNHKVDMKQCEGQ